MKKTYMVKKNPNLPTSADNWIFMNSYEFAMFMQTEEGQKRKKNFGQIDACGEEDDIIIAECGEESAKEWRAEKDAHDYLKECEAESGIETVSFYAVNDDGEEINLDETIADPNCDFENELFRRFELEQLQHALAMLPAEEYAIVYKLYLSESKISERNLAKKMGLPQKTLNNRKLQIFERIKKILKN